MAKSTRNILFDIIKGVAIYLVVLGHSIQYLMGDGWQENVLAKCIYMFHMPLFIFISGYFFSSSADKSSIGDFVKKKFVRILLPSITYGLMMIVVNTVLSSMKRHVLYVNFPENMEYFGLWFLSILFVISCLCRLFYNNKHNMYIYAFVAFLFVILPDSVFMVHQLRYLFPYFVLGIAMKRMAIERFPLWQSLVAFIVFVLCAVFYKMDYSMYFLSREDSFYWQISAFRFISGIVGIIAVFGLCRVLVKNDFLLTSISKLGGVTLPVYFIHVGIFSLYARMHLQTDNMAIIIAISVLVTYISIFIYRLLQKNKYLTLAMFGEHR